MKIYKKTYTKSQVLFNSEIVTSAPSAPKTREEVRNVQRAHSIQQMGGGIGYQIIGNNNQIA